MLLVLLVLPRLATPRTLAEVSNRDFIAPWEKLASARLPIVAAVNGVALGGGCEVAMMCDVIIASEKAQFGQPEIKLGVILGAGGTQCLTKAVGKSKAMEMCLTGEFMDAKTAQAYNLVSKVVPADKLMGEAVAMAHKIAAMSRPVSMLAKETVLASYNTPLKDGIRFERKVFHLCFGLKDRAEGMDAFVNKRDPIFTNE